MRSVVLVVGVLAAGCLTATTDVTGLVSERFHVPTGPIDRPVDLTDFGFQVYADGGLFPDKPRPGTHAGTFHIGDVPDGPYLLRIVHPNGYSAWEQQDDHDVQKTWEYIGRPDAIAAPVHRHDGHLQLTSSSPWATADRLFVSSWELGAEHGSLPRTILPSEGATSVDSTFVWNDGSSWPPVRMPDPALGDTVTIARLADTESANGADVSKLTQIATATPRVGDASIELAAAFVDVPATATQRLVIDLDPYRAQIPLAGAYAHWSTSIVTNPATRMVEPFGPPLLGVSSYLDAAGLPRVVDMTETHGRPFSASWPVMVSTRFSTVIGNGPWSDYRYAYAIEPLAEGEHVVSPYAAFVERVIVNGYLLEAGATVGVGTTCELLVTAPEDADWYYLLFWDGTRSVSVRASSPLVRLPAEALPPGDYNVRAWAVSDRDGATRGTSRDIAGVRFVPES